MNNFKITRIGELRTFPESLTVEWKIKDFISHCNESNKIYVTPVFKFFNASWILSLRFRVKTVKEVEDEWLELCLEKTDPVPSGHLDVRLALQSTDVNDVFRIKSTDFRDIDGVGFPEVISRSALIEKQSTLIPSNVLTVICSLKKKKQYDNEEIKHVQTGPYLDTNVCLESLSKDFSELLDSGPNHDVEIKCGQRSVKAHKIILCARSEVFNAMLQSHMREGRTGVIEIQDIDEIYIQEFVRNLYTGVIPELTFEKATALYEAGDKYAVRSLMQGCSEYLQENLSPENAIECLDLAAAHSDQKLTDRVLAYLLDQ